MELLQLNLERIARFPPQWLDPLLRRAGARVRLVAVVARQGAPVLRLGSQPAVPTVRSLPRRRAARQPQTSSCVALPVQGVTLREQGGALTDNGVLGLASGMVQCKRLAVSRQA